MNHQSRLSTGEHTLTDLPTFRPNSEKPNHSLQFVETAVNSSYNKDVENAPLMGMATHATQSSIGNPAIFGMYNFILFSFNFFFYNN
jgi:hypothetical protein